LRFIVVTFVARLIPLICCVVDFGLRCVLFDYVYFGFVDLLLLVLRYLPLLLLLLLFVVVVDLICCCCCYLIYVDLLRLRLLRLFTVTLALILFYVTLRYVAFTVTLRWITLVVVTLLLLLRLVFVYVVCVGRLLVTVTLRCCYVYV